MIEIKNLGKTFHTASGDVNALHGINLSINDGEIFGIIGLSGAGKSTLVRCINLLERPTEGDVIIDGQNMLSLPKKELLKMRRSIGMIFQSFNLLSQRNVIGNVCFPLEIAGVPKEKAAAKSRELLELVGLSDREKAYPSQLSGGQKQRVAIARALATDPKYLLCDEATSALDPSNTLSILELLKDINKKLNVTIIIITHEMKVIEEICEKVAIIDHSEIAEMGSVRDIFANPHSDIAKELILPKNKYLEKLKGEDVLHIIFDGQDSKSPVIADMVLSTGVPVNIIFADSKDIAGKAYGTMVISMPPSPSDKQKIFDYLNSKKITYKKEV